MFPTPAFRVCAKPDMQVQGREEITLKLFRSVSFHFVPFLPSSSITLQRNVCIDLTSMHTISLFSSPPILLVNVATVGRQRKRRRKKGSWTGFFRSTSLRLAFRFFACTLFVHLNRRYVEG
jgi:hypothetical protein